MDTAPIAVIRKAAMTAQIVSESEFIWTLIIKCGQSLSEFSFGLKHL